MPVAHDLIREVEERYQIKCVVARAASDYDENPEAIEPEAIEVDGFWWSKSSLKEALKTMEVTRDASTQMARKAQEYEKKVIKLEAENKKLKEEFAWGKEPEAVKDMYKKLEERTMASKFTEKTFRQ